MTDGRGLTATDTFVLAVSPPPPPNTPPTISDVRDRSVPQDGTTGTVPFTVGDTETPAGSLVVTASSSNPTLVPMAGVALGGTGTNRTVTVTPTAGQAGTVTITLTVQDGGGLTATDTFTLTVVAPPPPLLLRPLLLSRRRVLSHFHPLSLVEVRMGPGSRSPRPAASSR